MFFGDIQNNLKIRGSTAYPGRKLHKHSVSNLFFMLYHLMLSRKFQGSEIHHGVFQGLIFGPGIFWGFVGSPRDLFGF